MNRHPVRIVYLGLTMIFAAATLLAVPGPSTAAQETGSIRITLRSCGDAAVDPNTISTATCTIPLDAPDAAVAFWEGAERILVATELERDFNGTYMLNNVPAGAEVSLSYFQPVAHNYYRFTGVDENLIDGPWTGRITLVAGESRDVSVLYWNGEDGFRENDQSTIELTFRGCPEGIDPRVESDPVAACTDPADAPEAAALVWDMEGGSSISGALRLEDGTYRIEGIPSFLTVGLTALESDIRDNVFVTPVDRTTAEGIPEVDLYRGDTRHVHVFYHDEDLLALTPDPVTEEPGTTEDPVGENSGTSVDPGTIDLTLRGCPDGVDPTSVPNPAEVCTIPLDAPDTAGVIWGGDGQGGLEVVFAPQLTDGTYHLENIPSNTTITLSGFEPTVRNNFFLVGAGGTVVNADGTIFMEPGMQAHILVFYFNSPGVG